jgi:DNA polymerase I-like protein with 3'-5' exonuclease and polymerase domains
MLNSAITQIMRAQTPLRTLGGRIYYAEPPKKIDGQWRSFEYKLINYLVQGSAADLTKQAMIQWDEQRDLGERFLVQVYDEINISVPEDMAHKSMAKLKAVMEQPRMDVPMRSSGKVGYSWGQLETWDD